MSDYERPDKVADAVTDDTHVGVTTIGPHVIVVLDADGAASLSKLLRAAGATTLGTLISQYAEAL